MLQDTTKFLQYLNSLEKIAYVNPILFTIDVTSLYTVLPHEMCIEYVCEMYKETLAYWDNYTPDIRPIDCDMLRLLLKTVLDQSFFQFNEKIYKQNYGITMGAPSSVKIANITLHKHLYKLFIQYSGPVPENSYRLIDDIFGVWVNTKENLLHWFEFLNNSHETIKFTLIFLH